MSMFNIWFLWNSVGFMVLVVVVSQRSNCMWYLRVRIDDVMLYILHHPLALFSFLPYPSAESSRVLIPTNTFVCWQWSWIALATKLSSKGESLHFGQRNSSATKMINSHSIGDSINTKTYKLFEYLIWMRCCLACLHSEHVGLHSYSTYSVESRDRLWTIGSVESGYFLLTIMHSSPEFLWSGRRAKSAT